MKIIYTILCTLLFLPTVSVLAQDNTSVETVSDVERVLSNIVSFMAMVFGVVAVAAFLIAGFFYLTAVGNPEKIKKANSMILYGAIGIAVALLSWSMVGVIQSFLASS